MSIDNEFVATARVRGKSGRKSSQRSPNQSRGAKWTFCALLAILALLILFPAALILYGAFSQTVPRPGSISWSPTLDNFAYLGSEPVREAAFNSLVISVGGTALAIAIGAALAFLVARTNIPHPKAVFFFGLSAAFFPSYVGALAWGTLGAPASGLLNTLTRDFGLAPFLNIYTLPGIIFIMGLYYAPYAFLFAHSTMSLMNPDLEDAATIHGANTRRMLWKVTIPLAFPALMGAGLLIFIFIFENFAVAQAVASPGRIDTLPTMIYRLFNSFPSRGNEAAALAVLLVVVVVLFTWLQRRALMKRSYITVTGKGVRSRVLDLGVWRWPAFALGALYFTLAVLLPLAGLALTALRRSPYMTSLSELFKPDALSVGPFTQVFESSRFWQTVGNSVVVAIASALIGTSLAFLIAYVVYRTTTPGRGILEQISVVPTAIPGVGLGIGLLWTWLLIPVPLYGTLAMLVVGFVAILLPIALRGVTSSILSTDRDLEDAAVLLGASRTRAVLYTTIPLLRVGLTSTFMLMLMLSMREVTVPLFLHTSQTEILSVYIFSSFEAGGQIQQSAALSIVYVAIMFVLSYLPRRFGSNAIA